MESLDQEGPKDYGVEGRRKRPQPVHSTRGVIGAIDKLASFLVGP
jgi:hypothetical protein